MSSDAQILAPQAASGEAPDRRRWLTLAVLLLAAFMNLLDGTS
jgi:MYXO-CTERM domain-containing protein